MFRTAFNLSSFIVSYLTVEGGRSRTSMLDALLGCSGGGYCEFFSLDGGLASVLAGIAHRHDGHGLTALWQ
jgi:hypothetical protein